MLFLLQSCQIDFKDSMESNAGINLCPLRVAATALLNMGVNVHIGLPDDAA